MIYLTEFTENLLRNHIYLLHYHDNKKYAFYYKFKPTILLE